MARDWATILAEHRAVVDALDTVAPVLDQITEFLINTLRASRRVYTLGNGGSAADAQHIAGELLGRYKLDRVALPALALTTDSSTMTAIANDLGYEQIFARQLEGFLQTGDLVWALSTSGNSANILAAARLAREFSVPVIGFTGRGGGELARLSALCFKAPHDESDRIQEAHQLAYHYICEHVEAALA